VDNNIVADHKISINFKNNNTLVRKLQRKYSPKLPRLRCEVKLKRLLKYRIRSGFIRLRIERMAEGSCEHSNESLVSQNLHNFLTS
jgi:hypothetical protein